LFLQHLNNNIGSSTALTEFISVEKKNAKGKIAKKALSLLAIKM
jgi:hypothetical protein